MDVAGDCVVREVEYGELTLGFQGVLVGKTGEPSRKLRQGAR